MKKTKKKKVYSIYWVWHGCTNFKAKNEKGARDLFEAMDGYDVVKYCETGSFTIDHIKEVE